MNFQEKLKAELAAAQSNNNDVDYPSNHLKNKELRFEKDQTQLMVRILPPANDEDFFAVIARELWMNSRNRNGKDLNLNAVFPDDMNPESSALVANLLEWQNRGMVPNNFNKKAYPSRKAYVNAVQVFVDPATNQFVHEVDQQGNLVVRFMKLPFSAYTAILGKLSDVMMKPQGSDDFGIISAYDAFPIKITKPVKGAQTMNYTVDVYQRSLGPLPENWRDLLEDLHYQATPTEVYNDEYVDYFIKVVNGVEPVKGGGNAATGAPAQGGFQQPQVPNQYQQQAPMQGQYQQAPMQNQFQQQAPMQNQFQQPQAPMQGQNQFTQSSMPAQPPLQNQFQQPQQAPMQNQFQQPQAPTNQTMPTQFTQAPATQFTQAPPMQPDYPVITDADLPFNDMPDMGALAADPFPTNTQAPMTPPVTTQAAVNTLPDVNSILTQMQAKLNN